MGSKVAYRSKDGRYESTAYLDIDIWDDYDGVDVEGEDKYTEQRVVLVYTGTGWQEI